MLCYHNVFCYLQGFCYWEAVYPGDILQKLSPCHALFSESGFEKAAPKLHFSCRHECWLCFHRAVQCTFHFLVVVRFRKIVMFISSPVADFYFRVTSFAHQHQSWSNVSAAFISSAALNFGGLLTPLLSQYPAESCHCSHNCCKHISSLRSHPKAIQVVCRYCNPF